MTELILTLAILTILGYAIGSVSSGYIVGKVYRNVDIRRVGSGSTGATNTLRALGAGAAALVALFDVLKGVLAVLVARSFIPVDGWSSVAAGLAGFAAIAGHCWPALLEGRGGRGVATGFGTILLIAWPSWSIAVPVFVLAIAVTRIVSIGSLAALVTVGVSYLAFSVAGATRFDLTIFAYLVLGSLLVTWRHRHNLARIIRGTEPRIGERLAPGA
ncbi:MAG: glycerol-3-phosphate 1-O-acyltransferase [Chloroflexi bacterium]|nr:glycerol-3-phosphate 1-O-acyltransferase [Chloroflexota bacterium]